MKKNRLLLFAFVLFVFLPFSVNASGKDGDFVANGSKYVVEKNDMICKIDGKQIDLVNDENIIYGLADEEGNLIYADQVENDIYVYNRFGCSKYSMSSKEGMNYLLSITGLSFYNYDIVGEDVVIVKENRFALEVENSENNEIIKIKPLPSLDLDDNLNYYIYDRETDIAQPVTVDSVQESLNNNILSAVNYYVETDDDTFTETVLTITNQTVLDILNDSNKYVSVYDFDAKRKIAYFNYYDDYIEKVIDSNGNIYNGKKVYANSGNLLWSMDFVEDVIGEFYVYDKNLELLYTFDEKYNDDKFNDHNLYSIPIREIYYKDYVYGLLVNGNDNLYNVYEYKLLSENNRKTDGKTDFVTKFSGLAERVEKIKVDTNELDVDGYVTSGSTIVTLDPAYLRTLTAGKHIITVVYEDGVELTSDFTLETDSSGVTYNLTFDANGGVFKDGNSTLQFTNWKWNMLTTQEQPTREGYTFKGWYVDKEFKTPLASEPDMTNITIIYAKWKKEEENPKTFDGIGSSIFTGTISLIGLVVATLYFRKKNKGRA